MQIECRWRSSPSKYSVLYINYILYDIQERKFDRGKSMYIIIQSLIWSLTRRTCSKLNNVGCTITYSAFFQHCYLDMEHFFIIHCLIMTNDNSVIRVNHKAEGISRCRVRWVINSCCFVWFYPVAKYFLQILTQSKLKLNTSAAEKRVSWN